MLASIVTNRVAAEIGRVLDTLDEAGRLDGALIVVVADHGEHLGERGRVGHSAPRCGPRRRDVAVLREPE